MKTFVHMCIRSLTGITMVLFLIVLAGGRVYADIDGKSLQTYKTSILGCGTCHGAAATPSLNAVLSGPDTVYTSQTVAYTLTVSPGPAPGGGCDIAVSRGTLSPDSTYLKLDRGELVHTQNVPISGNSVTYEFNYTAPSTAGRDTIFAMGLKGDGDGKANAADPWNWAPNKYIVVQTAPSPPAAPTLASPANNATGVSTNPTLSWNASSGATSYRLQVSTVSNFSTTVYNQSGITGTSRPVTGLMNNTTYYWRVNASNAVGTSAYSSVRNFTTGATSVERMDNEVPQRHELGQNFPNPFNPTTTIEFSVVNAGYVTLTIYDALGGEIQTLVNQNLAPGRYGTQWNASEIPSGVYFYRLTAGLFVQTKKLVLLK